MHPGLILSLLIACAGMLLFARRKRQARHLRNVEKIRSRILFRTSARGLDEWGNDASSGPQSS